jgi:hypothetical protein
LVPLVHGGGPELGLECRYAGLRVASKAWVLTESDGKQPPVCLSVIRADTPEDLT